MPYQSVQELEEAKRKFILLVTHELRSPVGVIRSLLRTLAGGYAGELTETQSDLVDRADKRTEFLQTLIDDLLDLAASKTGLRGESKPEQIAIRELLTRIIERYRFVGEEKAIQLKLNGAANSSITVTADPDELDRAFNNLVSNAIKYTPERGEVTLTLDTVRDTARIQVIDSGIGIPEDALPHLFEEFYRAPNARARVAQGTGLGLTITKEIINRYGGTIRVSSVEGEGTTFTIVLPLASDDDNTDDTAG